MNSRLSPSVRPPSAVICSAPFYPHHFEPPRQVLLGAKQAICCFSEPKFRAGICKAPRLFAHSRSPLVGPLFPNAGSAPRSTSRSVTPVFPELRSQSFVSGRVPPGRLGALTVSLSDRRVYPSPLLPVRPKPLLLQTMRGAPARICSAETRNRSFSWRSPTNFRHISFWLSISKWECVL